jgi:L-alanine-DL-glutamate epimerase-like enolase superfamily enzyme
MRIVHASLRREHLPLRTPFVTALRRVERVEYVVLELRTDTGLRALGSAPATKAVTGETLETIETALRRDILPALLERPFGLDGLLAALHAACEGNTSAKAAADMALYSLAAQAEGLPLYRFLGAPAAVPLATAVTISLGPPRQMRDDALEAFGRGMDILKIKVGSDDGLDAERIATVAAALPEATILVDANQAWDRDTALGIVGGLREPNIALVEQPVPAEDLDALREVTAASPVPILADEAVYDAADAKRVIETRAADLVNVKLMKCGGIAGALEIVGLCREHGVGCMLGSMLEGPVSITAALHLAAAHADVFRYIDLDSPLLYRERPRDLPFRVEGNRYVL